MLQVGFTGKAVASRSVLMSYLPTMALALMSALMTNTRMEAS